MLTRDQIKNKEDRKSKIVNVWGGQVKVVAMSAKQYIEYQATVTKLTPEEQSLVGATLITFCCVDEEGKPLFTKEDASWLLDKSPENLGVLLDAALSLNSITSEQIEDQAKN
jgi:hypothetical protein